MDAADQTSEEEEKTLCFLDRGETKLQQQRRKKKREMNKRKMNKKKKQILNFS